MAKRWRQGSLDGGGAIMTIAKDPHGSDTLLCGGDVSGIHLSTTNGRRWMDRNLGRYTNPALKTACIKWHPTIPGTVYTCSGTGTGAGTGLYRSTDYGRNWSLLSAVPKFTGNRLVGYPSLPSPWPRNNGNLLEFVGTTIYAGTFQDGLMRSTDGGTTWTTIALGSGGPFYIRGITQDAAVPHRLFIATYSATAGGVYCVENANGTPTVTQLTNSPAKCEELIVLNSQLYVAAENGIYNKPSTPTDTVWGVRHTATGLWQTITGFHGGGQTTLYAAQYDPAVGSNGRYSTLIKSTNGGSTWTDVLQTATISTTPLERDSTWWMAINSPLAMLGQKRYFCSHIEVDPTDTNRVFLSGKSGVWVSEDAGASWYPASRELGATINGQVAIVGNNAIAADADWNFVRSDDLFKGTTRPVGKQVLTDGVAICTDGSNWYLGTGDYKTTNSGGSIYTVTGFTTPVRDTRWDIAGGTSSGQDDFNRTTASGWGTSLLGGAWTALSGNSSRRSTSAGSGIINTTLDNNEHIQSLNSVSITDVYFETTISFDRVPTGDYTEARIFMRGTTGGTQYYAITIRVFPTGTATVFLKKYNQSHTTVTSVIDANNPNGLITTTYTANQKIQITGSILGNEISATAFMADGSSDEPATVSYSDGGVTHGPVLTGPGTVGLITNKQPSSGGAIVSFGYSEWQALGDTGIAGAWPVGLVTGLNASGDRLLIAAAQAKGVWTRNLTQGGTWAQTSTAFSTGIPSNRRLPMAWSTVNGDTIWAFDLTSGVYRSTNYGSSWTQVWSKTGDTISYGGWIVADPTDGQVVWVIADDGFYKVTNARSGTWTPTLVTIPGLDVPASVTLAPNGDVYVVNHTQSLGSPPAIFKSTNHGASWINIADDAFRNMAAIPRDVAARNDGTVLVSTNGNGVLVYDESRSRVQLG